MHSGTFLKTIAAAALATTTLAGAGALSAAQAADFGAPAVAGHTWDLLFGVTATSQYISRGFTESPGPAIQPWAELDVGSFYLGYWGSNTYSPWENDLSVGVRGTHGPVSLDFGYVAYVYSGATYDNYGEVYVKGTINPMAPLTLGASVFYNPSDSYGCDCSAYVEGNAKYDLGGGLSISGAVGNQSYYGGGNTVSWNAGASYAFHNVLTLDGRYWGGGDSNKFVVSLSFATSLSAVKGGAGKGPY